MAAQLPTLPLGKKVRQFLDENADKLTCVVFVDERVADAALPRIAVDMLPIITGAATATAVVVKTNDKSEENSIYSLVSPVTLVMFHQKREKQRFEGAKWSQACEWMTQNKPPEVWQGQGRVLGGGAGSEDFAAHLARVRVEPAPAPAAPARSPAAPAPQQLTPNQQAILDEWGAAFGEALILAAFAADPTLDNADRVLEWCDQNADSFAQTRVAAAAPPAHYVPTDQDERREREAVEAKVRQQEIARMKKEEVDRLMRKKKLLAEINKRKQDASGGRPIGVQLGPAPPRSCTQPDVGPGEGQTKMLVCIPTASGKVTRVPKVRDNDSTLVELLADLHAEGLLPEDPTGLSFAILPGINPLPREALNEPLSAIGLAVRGASVRVVPLPQAE